MTGRVAKFLGGTGAAAAVLVTAGPAFAQSLGLAHDPEISLWRVVGALVFCCVLGAGGALALKYRLQGAKPSPRSFDPRVLGKLFIGMGRKSADAEGAPARLKVIETVRLSYQVDVSLLECDGERLVIVTTPQGAFIANGDAPTKTGTVQ